MKSGLAWWSKSISIPALREEGDAVGGHRDGGLLRFLSPPSARRATKNRSRHSEGCRISIPALREEGDHSTGPRAPERSNFYPRPPRGGRLAMLGHME